MLREFGPGCVTAVALVAVVLALLLFFSSLAVIPNGHIGIMTNFGSVVGQPLEPGLTPVFFWRGVTRLSTQTQEDRESAEVPTKEGLTVALEASLLYSIDKSRAIELFQTVGPNYKEVVVMPQFRSALRGVTVKHAAADLYTAHRAEIEDALEKSVGALLAERGIRMEKVLLRSIELPRVVKNAIERKLASEQEAAAMEFVIQKATKDAERQRVEAKGIADSQEIIRQTLTPEYLRYLWIKSLEEATKHGNTVVYIPTGGDGLPTFRDVGIPKKQ